MGGVVSGFLYVTIASVVGHLANSLGKKIAHSILSDDDDRRRLDDGGGGGKPWVQCNHGNGTQSNSNLDQLLTLVPSGSNCTLVNGDLHNIVTIEEGARLIVVSSNIDTFLHCDHCSQVSVISSAFSHGGILLTEPPLLEQSLNIEHTDMDDAVVRISKTYGGGVQHNHNMINVRVMVDNSTVDHMRLEDHAFVGVLAPQQDDDDDGATPVNNFFYLGGSNESFKQYSANLTETLGDHTIRNVSTSHVIELLLQDGEVMMGTETPPPNNKKSPALVAAAAAIFPNNSNNGEEGSFVASFGMFLVAILLTLVAVGGTLLVKRTTNTTKKEEEETPILAASSYGAVQKL